MGVQMYVDLDTMNVCTTNFLTRTKHPGLIVKNLSAYPLTTEDLARLNAAMLDEAGIGDVATGKAVKNGAAYQREYRDYTAEELTQQARSELAATDQDMLRICEDLINTLIDKGVISESDLPQAAQGKLANRRAKRAAL